jgi:hypothetical protein
VNSNPRYWRLLPILSVCVGSILLAPKAFELSASDTGEVPQAARSVHLVYPAPDASLFFNEVVVEKSTAGSYFMVCGWNTGYFGIQELANHHKVILFSVWDAAAKDDSVKPEDRVKCLYQSPDVKVRRFGGEGTGGQCMGDFDWAAGETNRFMVKATADGENTSYTGYVWIHGKKEWKRLVTFQVRTEGAPLRGLYSFVEDFRRDTKSAGEVRRARFGNGWVESLNGDWLPLDQAKFTASNSRWEAKETIDAGFDGAWFYLVTGGQTEMKAKLKDIIRSQDRHGAPHPRELPP